MTNSSDKIPLFIRCFFFASKDEKKEVISYHFGMYSIIFTLQIFEVVNSLCSRHSQRVNSTNPISSITFQRNKAEH